jgi:hypothetical protein
LIDSAENDAHKKNSNFVFNFFFMEKKETWLHELNLSEQKKIKN